MNQETKSGTLRIYNDKWDVDKPTPQDIMFPLALAVAFQLVSIFFTYQAMFKIKELGK